MVRPMSSDRIAELQQQIAELKKRWPAHSASPAMMEQLDALEEELQVELDRAFEEDQPG
jgi:hypothetical protein